MSILIVILLLICLFNQRRQITHLQALHNKAGRAGDESAALLKRQNA